jgi:formylmethanofuran dehydrogenase subunit E
LPKQRSQGPTELAHLVQAGEPSIADLAPIFDRLAALHPRMCPRQVLGVRMGLYGTRLLDLPLPRTDKRLMAFVEIDGCFADAVSVVTGCWFGRRTMRLVDLGKPSVTLVDTHTERAVRLRPDPRARRRAHAYAPGAVDRWHAQLEAYAVMPAAELLCAEPVRLTMSLATVVGSLRARVMCAGCGEDILNGREVEADGLAYCRSCAGYCYYEPLHSTCDRPSAEPPVN